MITDTQQKIIAKVESELNIKSTGITIPTQGFGGDVFIIKDKNDIEYVIKYSEGVLNDKLALDLIKKNNIDIPVPKMFGCFPFEGKYILVLEKVTSPILDSVPIEDRHKYLPSMISNLQKIHSIKSSQVGFLDGSIKKNTWKEYLLSKYSGEHPWFDWEKTLSREGVDRALVQSSINSLVKRIEQQDFIENNYSLVHTDFNQSNLFVNKQDHSITAIIDWSEAMFADLLYDFARVRMFILHNKMGEEAVKDYFRLLNLTEEEKEREDIYLVSQIIDYITWYSEIKNEFNDGRLKLHQSFLHNYKSE